MIQLPRLTLSLSLRAEPLICADIVSLICADPTDPGAKAERISGPASQVH